MRTLGLLGGMAWPSTLEAYRRLNEGVHARLGGHHSAQLLVWSADFARVVELQERGDWDEAARLLAGAAQGLQAAGAEGLMLCTNTMHRVADAIEASVSIPLLHIADATAERIVADGLERVGLLGTRFTMEQDFYRARLHKRGIEPVVPPADGRELVHRIIYDELVHGHVRDESRQRYLEVVDRLAADGAQGIIAGCTEIELLLSAHDLELAFYPTTRIHVDTAIDWLLG